jgi:tetratricopeptide (TPR) repeat protein
LERLPKTTLSNTAPAYAFAAHVPSIERELGARRYDRAAYLFSKWYGYRDGSSEPQDVTVAAFFRGDTSASFVATYQSFSCGASPLDLHNDPDTAAILARALVSAARGDYVDARRAALETYRRNPSIGEGLLLAGQIDERLGDRGSARKHWREALAVRAPVYPEEIGPDTNIIVVIEYLLHYRP